jgi:hypothetical protein
MRARSFLVAFAIAVTSLAAIAVAAEPEAMGVLAVAPPPGPGEELAAMTGQLRSVLAARSPGVLDGSALRDRMSGPARGASLAELDGAYQGALAAYLNGDYEGSVRTLRAIVQELEKLPEGAETFRHWTRAMLRLASTELDLDRRDAAREVAGELVRADPGASVDPVQFPPRVTKLIDGARAELRALPARKLSVRSTPSAARVFLNGREVGTTPLTVSVARGRYRVAGIQGSVRAPPIQVVVADDDRTVALDFSMAESLRPNQGPGLALPDSERAPRLVALGGFLRLDTVLATSVLDDAGSSYLLGTLYDVRRGMLLREGRVRLADRSLPRDGASRLADFFVTGKMAPPVEPYSPLRSMPVGVAERSRALGWSALATGVATVALGGVSVWQATSSSRSYDAARGLIQPNGSVLPQDAGAYGRHLSDGDAAKRVAVATGVAAGAAAVTTGVLAYLSYRQTGHFGPFRF